MVVISDTSVLIALGVAKKINLLHQMWKVIFIPEAVFREIREKEPGSAQVREAVILGWIKVKHTDEQYFQGLGLGESSCLELAKAMKADLVLMDERKGRKIARGLGYRVMGTVGIIYECIKAGIVPKNGLPAVLKAWDGINFRLGPEIVEHLKEV